MSSSITIEDLRQIILKQNGPKKSGYKDAQLFAFLSGVTAAYLTSTPAESGQVINDALYKNMVPSEEISRDKYLHYDSTPKYIHLR